MPKIPPDFVKKVKEANNILDIIGEHVVLKKSGSNYMGLSPFKPERTPSFSVSETKQLYHCFATGKGGDIVTFLMEVNGLSFRESMEELAQRASVPLPKDWSKNKEGSERQRRFEVAYKLNRYAASFFRGNLVGNPVAKEYLRSRGVDEELEKEFYLGSAPKAWDDLTRKLIEIKAPIKMADKLGLIRPSQKKGRGDRPDFFDLFRHRLMFPILDLRGRVCGFGGRLLPGEEQGPKYMNSPESPLFQKSQLAFGLYQAKKYIREKNEVILVEGIFDVLALHRAGFRNAVATCGTAMTSDHLKLFKRFGDKVVLLFDGDRAGIEATTRAMELGLDQGMILYGANLPGGLDPADFIAERPKGVEEIQEILKGAGPILDLRINELVAGTSDSESRSQALKKIVEWLKRLKDPMGQEVRCEAVAQQLRISRSVLDRALGLRPSGRPRSAGVAVRNSRRTPAPQTPDLNSLTTIEKILLHSLIKEGVKSPIWAEISDNLPPRVTLSELFEHRSAKSFTDWLLEDPENWSTLKEQPGSWEWGTLDPQVRSTISEALLGEEKIESESIKTALRKSMSKVWARFSHRLRAALADAEARNESEKQAQLMTDYLDVQRKMKEFNSFYE